MTRLEGASAGFGPLFEEEVAVMKGRKWIAVAGLSVMLGAAPARATTYLGDAGWGVAAAFANLGYMPTKLVYAGLGGLTGGLAWACTAGDSQVADAVWKASLGGTYVITPSALKGESGIAFTGTSADDTAVASGDTNTTRSLEEAPLQN